MAECQEESAQEYVSDEDKTKTCDPCNFRGIANPADTYCPVCIEYLCISCKEIHSSFKATRTHKLVKTEETSEAPDRGKRLLTNVMICDIHHSELVAEYCVTHEKAICCVCKIAKHRGCDTKDLKETAEERKKSLTDFFEDMQILSSEFEKIICSRKHDKTKILEVSEGLRLDVKRIKDELISWTYAHEKDALEKIDKFQNQLTIRADSHIALAQEMKVQLEMNATSSENLINDGLAENFVRMVKTVQLYKEGKEMKCQIQQEIEPLRYNYRKSEKLSSLVSDISSLGMIKKEVTRDISFTEISNVTKKNAISAQSQKVTGCVFMPNGELVICDETNNAVKVFTSDFELKDQFQCNSEVWDIAVISPDEVIVTQPTSKKCLTLALSRTVKEINSIPIGENCFGVDFKTKTDLLFVSCHLMNGKGGNIKTLTLDGVHLNTFWIGEGNPYYVAVNDSMDRMIVCTDTSSKVLCMDMTGKTIFAYSDRQINCCRGLMFDSHGNFMVCGAGTEIVQKQVHFLMGYEQSVHIVYVVKKDGTKHKILLSSNHDLRYPYCLAYRSTDKTLVVGQSAKMSLIANSINI